MAVAADGRIAGNVSAGCVDAAVVEEATAVLGGAPPRVVQFGITDEAAHAVGLAFGGRIGVLITPATGSTKLLWQPSSTQPPPVSRWRLRWS